MSITASKLISLLDFTRLEDDDTESVIIDWCSKAKTPLGNVAAVCVYPQFIRAVKKTLNNSGIKIATVINFPHGDANPDMLIKTVAKALDDGADEIDWVMPYQYFIAGNRDIVKKHLTTARKHTPTTLKIILESGAFAEQQMLGEAALLAIDCGADFIKTSTGKITIGATLDAANTMVKAIKERPQKNVGIKLSGGIATVAQAQTYLELITTQMGDAWISPENIRFGASRILTDILNQ